MNNKYDSYPMAAALKIKNCLSTWALIVMHFQFSSYYISFILLFFFFRYPSFSSSSSFTSLKAYSESMLTQFNIVSFSVGCVLFCLLSFEYHSIFVCVFFSHFSFAIFWGRVKIIGPPALTQTHFFFLQFNSILGFREPRQELFSNFLNNTKKKEN